MKQQLQEISDKSHAETIDLWPEIYSEIKETKKVKNSSRRGFVLSRVAMVLALFFVGAVVYAFGQFFEQIYVDSGLEGARAERLVTPMNISATQGDLTMRLDWAYADVSRVSAGYTILDKDGNVVIPENENEDNWVEVKLFQYTEGVNPNEFPMVGGLGFRYRSQPDSAQQIFSAEFPTLLLFAPIEDMLWLEIGISLQGPEATPFRFEFPLKVYPALFEITRQEMVSDSTMGYVRQFIMTPSLTNLVICFPLSSEILDGSTSRWVASGLRIYFDNQELSTLYPNVTGYFGSVDPGQNPGCTQFYLAIPLDVLPERVRIVVQELREDPNRRFETLEEAEVLAAIYRNHGVEAVASESFSFEPSIYGVDFGNEVNDSPLFVGENFLNLPAFEQQAVYEAVMDDYLEVNPELFQVEGPWEIEFEVGEPIN